MLKRTITNMKNPPEGLNSHLRRQKKPSTLSQDTTDTRWTQQSVRPRTGRTETKEKGQSPRNLWAPSDTPTHTHTLGAPEERKERGRKNISRNYGWESPNLMKSIIPHIQAAQQTSHGIHSHIHTQTRRDEINLESCARGLTTGNWVPCTGTRCQRQS